MYGSMAYIFTYIYLPFKKDRSKINQNVGFFDPSPMARHGIFFRIPGGAPAGSGPGAPSSARPGSGPSQTPHRGANLGVSKNRGGPPKWMVFCWKTPIKMG